MSLRDVLHAFVFLFSVSACVSGRQKNNPPATNGGGSLDPVGLTGDLQVMCPEGTRFNAFPRVCVTRGGFALGPFPLELQELCREKSPDDASTCVQKQDWPFELLMSLVSSYKNGCPPGTAVGEQGVCVGPDSVYGPFTLKQVMACRSDVPLAQQKQCDDVVWPPDFIKFVRMDGGEKKRQASSDVVESGSRGTSSSSEVLEQQKNKARLSDDSSESAKSNAKSDKIESNEQKVVEVRGEGQKSIAQEKLEANKDASEKKQIPEESVRRDPTYCVFSWDEVPGTADLTTIDRRMKSLGKNTNYLLDRLEKDTLLGNQNFQSLDMCGRARFLKGCFQRVLFLEKTPEAQTFRTWALGRVQPLEAQMAFVMTHSRLGLWHDECWKGRCRGIGIAGVQKGLSLSGNSIPEHDVLWRGMTHNLITNLRFGLREIAGKAALGPSDLFQLARSFKKTGMNSVDFARSVENYYRQLIACQLD